jgi:hypothetical protein
MTWKKTLKQIADGSLSKLELSGEVISLQASNDLAVALESRTCRLSYLMLWNNELGDQGAEAVHLDNYNLFGDIRQIANASYGLAKCLKVKHSLLCRS